MDNLEELMREAAIRDGVVKSLYCQRCEREVEVTHHKRYFNKDNTVTDTYSDSEGHILYKEFEVKTE